MNEDDLLLGEPAPLRRGAGVGFYRKTQDPRKMATGNQELEICNMEPATNNLNIIN